MKSFALRNIALAATVFSFGAFAQAAGGVAPAKPPAGDVQPQQLEHQDTMTPTDTTQKGSMATQKVINLEHARYLIILPAGVDQQQVFSDLAASKAVEKLSWSCEEAALGGTIGGSASLGTQATPSTDTSAELGAADKTGTAKAEDKGTNINRQGRSATPAREDARKDRTAAAPVVLSQCTGYMFVNADSEAAALQNLPDAVRSKAKTMKLHKFTKEEQKNLTSKTSSL